MRSYFCQVRAAANFYLNKLGKLYKRFCKAVGPGLTASHEIVTHFPNVVSLSLFCRVFYSLFFQSVGFLSSFFVRGLILILRVAWFFIRYS